MAATEGLIFNRQRFSLQDGPGLRTTVFLKGCPLACLWCHNPESQSSAPEVLTIEGRCIRCGACQIRRAGADVCPTGARQEAGTRMGVAELCADLLRDRIFFDQSGGGVTFSGGEPLLQAAFVAEAAALLRARGVHTALDTCGHADTEALLRVASGVDLVLFDLKHLDGARHRAATGVSNALILANLEALSRAHDAIWVRVPIIPGLNDDAQNLGATARLAAATPGVRRVDLLPYHAIGAAKFGRIGKTYPLADVEPPSAERMAEIAQGFRSHGLETTIGGRP